MILIDSYSKWPEVYFTTTDNAAFTTKALHKVSSRVGVPTALVTDNGTHFMVQEVRNWLRSVGCRHLLTPPRHQQYNGGSKNSVRVFKRAVKSIDPHNFEDLEAGVNNSFMQFRSAAYSTIRSSPAQRFKDRRLCTNLLRLHATEVTYFKSNELQPSLAT